MRKTILFISSMDTKQEEIQVAAKIARKSGCETVILDTSTKTVIPGAGDIGPVEILEYSQISWSEFETMNKGTRIETMARAVVAYVKKLCRQKRFDGVMSIFGCNCQRSKKNDCIRRGG